MWSARTTKYATPNVIPVVLNALGTANDTISIAAITQNTAIRTPPSSGLSVFVSHAYAAHAHHTAPSSSTPRSSPSHVGSAATKPVTCVIPKHEYEVEEQ